MTLEEQTSDQTELVKCEVCGHIMSAPVRIVYRTLQPRGSGAKYAHKIMRLNPTHKAALQALISGDGKKGFPATDFNSGMELTDVWSKVREFRLAIGGRVPTKQGVSGRLSELQGLGFTHSEDNKIQLEDRDSMQFRGRKHWQRWYLAVSIEVAERAIKTGSPVPEGYS